MYTGLFSSCSSIVMKTSMAENWEMHNTCQTLHCLCNFKVKQILPCEVLTHLDVLLRVPAKD